jgi:meiotic recombination protein DMC1
MTVCEETYQEDMDDGSYQQEEPASEACSYVPVVTAVSGDGFDFRSIDELQGQGIGAADIQKLRQAGICSVKGIQMTSKRNLLKLKGMSEAKVDKIKEAAGKLCDVGFISALELSVRRENVFNCTTGSQEFDRLLGGGVQSMAMTEVFGEFRTGKTQLCLTLCVSCQIIEGELRGKAAFIDTEGTFRPERLREIANRFGVDPEQCLENVLYARAFNSEHQMDLINGIAVKMAEEPNKYRLLVRRSFLICSVGGRLHHLSVPIGL